MGNSATKEQRQAQSRPSGLRHHSSSGSAAAGGGLAPLGRQASPIYSSRPARGSRPDLSSLLGLGGSSHRDEAPAETRRETKQEREARKLEKERIAREKERERSMREESVDGGFLVTQGVYTGPEDFNKAIVRQLMIERRLAPFWKGLNDHSDSWTEHQLVAAARGLPLPAADDIPPEYASRSTTNVSDPAASSEQARDTLNVPIVGRTQSATSDGLQPASSLPSTGSPLLTASPTSPLFRGRSKTLASLTTSKTNSPMDMTPREMNLPKDPYVNGQPVEAYLYKDASECPICFLYYPPYLNKTRCCDQAICSECFVQIKRPDPHPPEHNDSNDNGEAREQVEELTLVSEPAACPFCVQPEFGITYEPPPFRKGLVYASAGGIAHAASAMSSSSSLSSSTGVAGDRLSPLGTGRRRTTSLSATSPAVITTDKIRPDWAQKLANARAHAARRSAAATALHTAAYLLNNNNSGAEARGFGGFGRRGGLIRRAGGSNENVGESRPRDTFGAGGLGGLIQAIDRESGANNHGTPFEGPSVSLTPGRGSSRRSRLEDLEEMMMMEAIRLSLAAEEERKRKEDKEAKKQAKKKEKETKKAEKAAKKGGFYHGNTSETASASSVANSPHTPTSSVLTASSLTKDSNAEQKGKGVDRPQSNASDVPPRPSLLSEPSSSSGRPRSGSGNTTSDLSTYSSDHPRSHLPDNLTPSRPSHLRHVSNTSSSASSFLESGAGSVRHEFAASNTSFDPTSSTPALNTGGEYDSLGPSTPAGGATSLEPMLNFRSLAAMIGEQEKEEGNTSSVNHSEESARLGADSDELHGEVGPIPASEEGDLGESVATVKALNPEITAQASDHDGPTSTSSQA